MNELTYINIDIDINDNSNNSIIEVLLNDRTLYTGHCSNGKLTLHHKCNRLLFQSCDFVINVIKGSVCVGAATTRSNDYKQFGNNLDRRSNIKINNVASTLNNTVDNIDLHLIMHVYPWHYGWRFYLNTNDKMNFVFTAPIL
jgi:hypothetical protein